MVSQRRLYHEGVDSDFQDLVKVQKNSYASFINIEDENSSLHSVFNSTFPIEDTYGRANLEFVGCSLDPPRFSEYECIGRGTTYASALKSVLRLVVWEPSEDKTAEKTIKDIREQKIYMGDIPMMTNNGTFIINGVERVVVSQMHRAPGAFFDHDHGKSYASGRINYFARIIPYHGSWLDFEFDTKNILHFRIDKKRKLPITVLLKALGLSTSEILKAFYDVVECKRKDEKNWILPFNYIDFKGVKLKNDLIDADTGEILIKANSKLTIALAKKFQRNGLKNYILPGEDLEKQYLADDIIDPNTGQVIAVYGKRLDLEHISKIDFLKIDSINLLKIRNQPYILNSIEQYDSSYDEAMVAIYKVIRPGEIPSVEAAAKLFESLFFTAGRYDLLNVGRVRLNAKFNLKHDENLTTLTKEDIICTLKELIRLQEEVGDADDIDHLGNRRVRSIGEFLENQFRIGIARMARVITENMASADFEATMPCDLVNSKILIAVIKEFFMSSSLSQFMDQTNPLSEITHKRRLSALGPGGLNRGRAGFEVRDVHPTHYGRICTIETPEGQNIGLINSLAIYAKVNKYGFIETPYKRVENGIITNNIEYLSAIDEAKYYICQANVETNENSEILGDSIYCRKDYETTFTTKDKVQYADVSAKQIVSVAAALIPFLENDEANRALMGSNMQRQAVPLLSPALPLIGTGMEGYVAKGSGAVITAKRSGVVEYVDALTIVIRSNEKDDFWVDSYVLRKFQKSNHNTCINQKPLVSSGQVVKEGEIIADGPATDSGELALGRNLVVAFMSWHGYNFEDSILISSNVIKEDMFTSIHIEEFECMVRDTRLGPEEITRDIPNVGEEFLYHLDEFGIVHVGANVEPGDVLVGKVTPKGESPITAEEKLLKAIFGEKAIDVKDSSLYLSPGVSGRIIDVKVLLRRGIKKDGRALLIEQAEIKLEKSKMEHELAIFSNYVYTILEGELLGQTAVKEFVFIKNGDILTREMLQRIPRQRWWEISISELDAVNNLKQRFNQKVAEITSEAEKNIEKLKDSYDLPQGVLSIIKIYVAVKHTLQPGDKMSGRHGNKGVISRIVPQESMPYLKDGRPVDIVLNPLGVPSRMNVGQVLETHLGWAAYKLGDKIKKLLKENKISELKALLINIYQNDKYLGPLIKKMEEAAILEFALPLQKGIPVAASVFEGPKSEEIERLLALSDSDISGQEVLYDGMTGEPFDRKVTVGCIYMLKLHHLVNDKIHARSVGPYSLITQQPLGGKAHFGGQRFGEMECWALQAYGAAFTLQEMLTIKSDDVVGRVKVYDSIIKGASNFYYGTPESLNVMLNELRALGLKIGLNSNPDVDFKLENIAIAG